MTAEIRILHPRVEPLSGFIRVGHTGHRKIEALHVAGRFPYRRVVFDAAHIEEQQELLNMLRAAGCETVLDPNFAEMSMAGRFKSAVAKLPWANPGRPWEASDFARARNMDVTKLIAEFAVKNRVNVVLAPTHFLEPTDLAWQATDLATCDALRHSLDQSGGRNISIDYQLITANALLKDKGGRERLIAGIESLPIDNVWIRTSGFGATSTGAGTRLFIEAVRGLHQIGRPLVADGVGGLSGIAAAAFGATGSICHGVAQREGFDASDWKRPSPQRGGGAAIRIYLPELDRYLTASQLNILFGVRGGRSRFGCSDSNCCRDGSEDMIENSHAHFITQRFRQLSDLSAVPEMRRAEQFLLRHVDPAVRSARFGAHLRIADEGVEKIMSGAKTRLVRLRDALADLHAADSMPSRSRAPAFRGSADAIHAVSGL